MANLITVNEEFFSNCQEDKDLLKCLREQPGDLQKKVNEFDTALDRMKQKYNPDGNFETMQDGKRKQWRHDRSKLYHYLLLLALGAEGNEWKKWTVDDSALALWDERVSTNLEEKSIFKHMLDIIHEDEEIMFKFYYFKTEKDKDEDKNKDKVQKPCKWCRGDLFWLVQSIKRYRMHFFHPVVDALKDWDENQEEKDRKDLLKKAMEVFKDKVSRHVRSWSERSWRNRARLYWLLGLARHAPMSNGKLGSFKSLEYIGPIGLLVQDLIQEDEDLILVKKSKNNSFLFQCSKAKYDKENKTLLLGRWEVSDVLGWASAANDHNLVRSVLKSSLVHLKSNPDCDFEWEKAWKDYWAVALWNAAYEGNEEVVKELLNGEFSNHVDHSEYYATKKVEPPLHVAVRRGHIKVVGAFCKTELTNFSCHGESFDEHTPLEVSICLKDTATKTKIQSLLLRRAEVKDAVEELSKQRELIVSSANAILVGATLIAGVTYGGWLSPPLGYTSYYQFAEPIPAPPDSYESYMAVQGNKAVEVFAIFNSLSFFFAIGAVMAGMETACFIKAKEELYLETTVKKLWYKLKSTTCLFIACVICALIGFSSAGIAILPPMKQYQRKMYITIGVGGTICMVFVSRMLLFCVSIHLSNWIRDQFEPVSNMLKKTMKKIRNNDRND